MERCERFLDLISLSLDGQLTQQEQQALDEHLSQCPDCRALLAELSNIHDSFSAFEAQDVPEGFTAGVMDRVREYENSKKVIPLWKNPQLRVWGSLAACAVLCVGLMRSGMFPSAQDAAPMVSPAAAPAACSVAAEESAPAEAAAFSLERSVEIADTEKFKAASLAPVAEAEEAPCVYPVSPEDSKWEQLSDAEKLGLCQIPGDMLAAMSTASLVEAVLEHPCLEVLFTADDPQAGIESLAESFNGAKELLAREDAADCLQAWLDAQSAPNMQYSSAEALLAYLKNA